MRKCSCSVIYNRKTLFVYNITVYPKQHDRFSFSLSFSKFRFDSFKELYVHVIELLKQNNLYCDSYTDFGVTVYDIQWINTENFEVGRYGIQ